MLHLKTVSHVQHIPAENERRERKKECHSFCYAVLAKIEWQIVIKLEGNKLAMFVPSQVQVSFHLDNESFTVKSVLSLTCRFNQQIDIAYRKLPIIRAVLSWGKVRQHTTAPAICRIAGFCLLMSNLSASFSHWLSCKCHPW